MTKVAYLFKIPKRAAFFLFFFISLWCGITVSAQTIPGKVIDNRSGEPVIGATVTVKGQQRSSGTVTDSDGKFVITVSPLPAAIVISYVGYKTEEIDIYEKTSDPIIISLEENTNLLDAVVVVGYGAQKRSDLTGAVTTVPVESLNQIVSSFERALQGAVSGVQITQNSGQPGGATSIRIRGNNSVNGGNEPLYVIDGFPVYNDNSLISAGAATGGGLNALASFNPNDIESINVLKDASATAIYGARGANGVILITTKKGKVGKSVVSYDFSYGTQTAIHPISVLTDSREWARLRNDARTNAGKAPWYTDEQIADLPEGTDWQAAAFRNASVQSHQISISGGSETTRYAISGNYFGQDGIVSHTNFKRYSGRVNLDQKVFSRLTVGTNMTASRMDSDIANDNVIKSLLLMPPVIPIRDRDGGYTYQSEFESAFGNPIAALEKVANNSTSYRFLGNAYGEYNFGKGFSAKVTLGADMITNKENWYVPSTVYLGSNTPAEARGAVAGKTSFSWLNENTVNYTGTFNRIHALSALVGYTQQAFRSEHVLARAQGFITDLLAYNDLGSGKTYNQPGTSAQEWALNSFLGRVNYGYNSKYYVTFTARADGSSRFGKNEKWGFFPSVALAYNLANEKFINLPKAVNSLKLRASAGLTGNQEIGLYRSLSTLASNIYYFGGKQEVGFSPNSIGNPDLGWEKTLQYDGGIDISFFGDRLTVTLDVYYKKTSDLLLNVPLPFTAGQSSALLNYGSVSNKGLELSIGTSLKLGNVAWNGNLTCSLNRNKVLSLGDEADYIIDGVSIAQVGKPLGSFYGLKTAGIFQLSDDTNGDGIVDGLPVYLTRNHPGDQRYVDIDIDSKITDTGDRTVIGCAEPKFTGGFINNFTWRYFDFSFFLQGSFGNQVYNRNKEQLEILSGQQGVSVSALNRWTPAHQGNTVPRAFEDPAVIISSRNVEDASYLRLKELSLGYTLPGKFTSRFFVSSLRIYVSAQNLFTATAYSGYDPEVSTNTATINQGIDNSSYPNAKSFYGGLSIKF